MPLGTMSPAPGTLAGIALAPLTYCSHNATARIHPQLNAHTLAMHTRKYTKTVKERAMT